MFQKKRKKGWKFENLGKNVLNLKIFWKNSSDCVRLSNKPGSQLSDNLSSTGKIFKPWYRADSNGKTSITVGFIISSLLLKANS